MVITYYTFVQAYVTKPVARSGLNLLKDWSVSGIIIKTLYSLFPRQCKVYQPARSQRKKGAKKKKKKKKKTLEESKWLLN